MKHSLQRLVRSAGLLVLALPVVSSAQTISPLPLPPTSAVTIDASVIHTATPDELGVSITCTLSEPMAKPALLKKAAEIRSKIDATVRSKARLMRQGRVNTFIYSTAPNDSFPMEAVGTTTTEDSSESTYTGETSFEIRSLDSKTAVKVAAVTEELLCTTTWDARIYQHSKFIRQYGKELRRQIAEKQAAYEETFGVKLGKANAMYFNTTSDPLAGSYNWTGSYDPEKNQMDVISTLSVSFPIQQ